MDEGVLAMDRERKLLWHASFTSGSSRFMAPFAFGRDGTLYLASFHGKVYAIGESK